MMKKQKKRPASNGAWPARPVADDFEYTLPVKGDEGARIAALLEGQFDNVDIKRAFDQAGLPEELPDTYLCIAPQETEMVYDYFETFDSRNEQAAYTHVSLCAHCSEAVAARALREAVGQKGSHHQRSGGELERAPEVGEAEAANYAVGVADQRVM